MYGFNEHPMVDVLRIIVRQTPIEFSDLWKLVCVETYQIVSYPDIESMTTLDLCKYFQKKSRDVPISLYDKESTEFEKRITTSWIENNYIEFLKTFPKLLSIQCESFVLEAFKNLDQKAVAKILGSEPNYQIIEIYILWRHVFKLGYIVTDIIINIELMRTNDYDIAKLYLLVQKCEEQIEMEEFGINYIPSTLKKLLPITNWDSNIRNLNIEEVQILKTHDWDFIETLLQSLIPLRTVFDYVRNLDMDWDKNDIFSKLVYHLPDNPTLLKDYLIRHKEYNPKHFKFIIRCMDHILFQSEYMLDFSFIDEYYDKSKILFLTAKSNDMLGTTKIDYIFQEDDNILDFISILIENGSRKVYVVYYFCLFLRQSCDLTLWKYILEKDPSGFCQLFRFASFHEEDRFKKFGISVYQDVFHLYKNSSDENAYTTIMAMLLTSNCISLADIFKLDEENFLATISPILDKTNQDDLRLDYKFYFDVYRFENQRYIMMILAHNPENIKDYTHEQFLDMFMNFGHDVPENTLNVFIGKLAYSAQDLILTIVETYKLLSSANTYDTDSVYKLIRRLTRKYQKLLNIPTIEYHLRSLPGFV